MQTFNPKEITMVNTRILTALIAGVMMMAVSGAAVAKTSSHSHKNGKHHEAITAKCEKEFGADQEKVDACVKAKGKLPKTDAPAKTAE